MEARAGAGPSYQRKGRPADLPEDPIQSYDGYDDWTLSHPAYLDDEEDYKDDDQDDDDPVIMATMDNNDSDVEIVEIDKSCRASDDAWCACLRKLQERRKKVILIRERSHRT